MATRGIAEAYLASGWCSRCGGKRDIDNNCANCDRWYNHPLLTVGGSLTLAVLLTLFFSIRGTREDDPGFARSTNSTPYITPGTTFVPTISTGSTRTGAPKFMQPAVAAAMPTNATNAPRIAPLEAQFTLLESLRQQVHSNERAFRNQMSSEPGSTAQARGTLAVAMRTDEVDR